MITDLTLYLWLLTVMSMPVAVTSIVIYRSGCRLLDHETPKRTGGNSDKNVIENEPGMIEE